MIKRPLGPFKLVIEQDCISAYEDTGRPFFRDVLDMDWDAVMVTDLATLSDFTGRGLPDLDAHETHTSVCAAWDHWVKQKICALYSLEIASTGIRLVVLFEKIEQAKREPTIH